MLKNFKLKVKNGEITEKISFFEKITCRGVEKLNYFNGLAASPTSINFRLFSYKEL
jgi:hypothetical protein